MGDPHGEAFYLRDDATGAVWSPLPGPVPGPCDYEVRHGFGYSRFHSACHDIDQEVMEPGRSIEERGYPGFNPRHATVAG